jgi:hypothetical protein
MVKQKGPSIEQDPRLPKTKAISKQGRLSLVELGASNFYQLQSLHLLCFSFLDGSDLYGKVAVLSKRIRRFLPTAGLLGRNKVLAVSNFQPSVLSHLAYAFKLFDYFEFKVTH